MTRTMDAEIDDIRAQAAAWLARLHSDARQSEDQAAFQTWLSEDPRHHAAFEAITTTWDLVGGVQLARPMRAQLLGPSRRGLLIGGGLAAAGALAGTVWFVERGDVYVSGRGEQKRVALADGSWLILDTDTRLRVRLGRERRAITLEYGRAYFDVASDVLRPFVVNAGNRDVVVTGTAFDVQHADENVSVTLERGRVFVRPASDADGHAYALVPGDRIAFASGTQPRQDRPDLALAMAWRTGRLGFDRETLSHAVAEMNRYGGLPLVIADPAIANLQISGLYSAGDSADFARSIALLLPVSVDVETSRVVLTAAPHQKSSIP
jgi:transmembrane sensor